MYLKLDDLEIKEKHLTTLLRSGDQTIHFRGRALEGEGRKIRDRLSRLEEGQIVECVIETRYLPRSEGIFKIVEINTPSPNIEKTPSADKAPIIYRFSGKLTPFY